jgi:sulfate transport system permease protein
MSSATAPVRRHLLPGFGLTLGVTLLYIAIIVAMPLAAMLFKAASLGWADFWAIISSERSVSALRVTLLCALGATAFNAAFGLLMAWVLVRYRFPGRRLLDGLVDLPFALPTAVAGLALVTVFSNNGVFGQLLAPLGIKVAYTPLGIMLAMAFTSTPFVVRTVQPVLEDMQGDLEEAAHALGATRWQIFSRIIWPTILPAFTAGCTLAFARSIGEFGAVVFIAGNLPFETEIVSLLMFIRLDEYDYPSAAALATVLLLAAFVLLVITNILQSWQLRYAER